MEPRCPDFFHFEQMWGLGNHWSLFWTYTLIVEFCQGLNKRKKFHLHSIFNERGYLSCTNFLRTDKFLLSLWRKVECSPVGHRCQSSKEPEVKLFKAWKLKLMMPNHYPLFDFSSGLLFCSFQCKNILAGEVEKKALLNVLFLYLAVRVIECLPWVGNMRVIFTLNLNHLEDTRLSVQRGLT